MKALNFILLTFLTIFLSACSHDEEATNQPKDEKQKSTSSLIINEIESSEWCLSKSTVNLTGEVTRIQFIKDSNSDFKYFKIDTLVKHGKKWFSYKFGDTKYNWKLAPEGDSNEKYY